MIPRRRSLREAAVFIPAKRPIDEAPNQARKARASDEYHAKNARNGHQSEVECAARERRRAAGRRSCAAGGLRRGYEDGDGLERPADADELDGDAEHDSAHADADELDEHDEHGDWDVEHGHGHVEHALGA
jgi:hypothetical protein